MVQPLVGKILLPVLGGSPAVWSICMVFFQAVLLLGYLYAHLLSTRVPPRWQWAIHIGVLIAASLTLPLPIDIGDPAGDPPVWLIRTLAATAGLPFFALSATAPLVQKWFSRTAELKARDPYFLYAASNAGSLLGLLGYLLVEPVATRTIQVTAWAAAFWSVSALIAACAYLARTGSVESAGHALTPRTLRSSPKTRNREAAPRTQHPAPGIRWLWILLSLVPSALLLGVTQHLATDVVSAPFVWVVPLTLYLCTFIAAFSTRGFGSAKRWGSVAPALVLVIAVLSLAEVRYPVVAIAFAHLAAFIALAMLCHTRLAEARPDPSRLTEYFLCISLGGVLGGAVVALIAPLVFSSIHEYPLAIAAALLLRPQTALADRATRSSTTRWLWRAAAVVAFAGAYWGVSTFDDRGPIVRVLFAVPAVVLLVTHKTAMLFAGAAAGLLVAAGNVRTGGEVVHRERTFFGVHEVTFQQGGDWHVLTHGTTTHGIQAFRGSVRSLPTTYYHPTGPIGDVVFALSGDARFRDVAVVGLGAGSLAGYAGNGVRMDFFEVDEAVIRIAENPRYFTYLSDARARPGVTLKTSAVDGRLGLRAMPASSYDLIVIDAFSSDAIPAHLVTREAIALFASRLKPRGVMAFHVSSRFFNLGPVLARIAEDRGLVSYIRNDKDVPPDRLAEAKRPSVWVALARSDNDLGQIPRSAPRWVRLSAERAPLWTDDYTNVLGALED